MHELELVVWNIGMRNWFDPRWVFLSTSYTSQLFTSVEALGGRLSVHSKVPTNQTHLTALKACAFNSPNVLSSVSCALSKRRFFCNLLNVVGKTMYPASKIQVKNPARKLWTFETASASRSICVYWVIPFSGCGDCSRTRRGMAVDCVLETR